MLERKAGFIGQLLSGKSDARVVEDLEDSPTLSYAEVKAIATGDQRLVELAGLQAETSKLERLKQSHDESIWRLRQIKRSATLGIERLSADLDNLDRTLEQRRDTSGDKFAARVGTMPFSERRDAGAALVKAARGEVTRSLTVVARGRADTIIGSIGGFGIKLAVGGAVGQNVGEMILASPYPISIGRIDLREEVDPVGIVRSIEHKLKGFEQIRSEVTARIDHLKVEIRNADARMSVPYEHQQRLDAALARQAEIEAILYPREESPAARAAKAAAAFEQVLENGLDAMRNKADGREIADLAAEHVATLIAANPDHYAALAVQRHLEAFRTPSAVVPPADTLSPDDLQRRRERAFRLVLECPAGVDPLGPEKAAEVMADARVRADALIALTPDHQAAARVIRNLIKLEDERKAASAPPEPVAARAYG